MAQGHKDRLSAVDASFLHQERESSHMHVGAIVVLEGPPPTREEFSRAHRVAAAPRAALPPEALLPALRDGPAVLDRRPPLQHRLPRAPHGAARRRGRSSSCAGSRGGSSPSAWTARSRCGRSGWSRASRTTASRSSPRPTTRSWTACPGVDIATVLFDLAPVPEDPPEAEEAWTPAPEPSQAELVAEGIKGLIRTPGRLAGEAVKAASDPGGTAGRGARGGRGRRARSAWAGLNPAPDVPLNVPIGPHRRACSGPRATWPTSRRSRTGSAAP